MREAEKELDIEQDEAQEENSYKNEVLLFQSEGRQSVEMVPLGHLSFHYKLDVQMKKYNQNKIRYNTVYSCTCRQF